MKQDVVFLQVTLGLTLDVPDYKGGSCLTLISAGMKSPRTDQSSLRKIVLAVLLDVSVGRAEGLAYI